MFENVKGSGKITSENKNTGTFTSIRSAGSIDIVISQSETDGAVVETDDNIHQYIVIENDKGTLNIHYKENVNVNPTKTVVYLSCKKIDYIASSGSGDISTKGNFRTDNINISHSGSGDFELDVTLQKLTIKKSGSGNVHLKGAADYFSITSSGSGNTEASQLNCTTAMIRSSGSGDYVLKNGVKAEVSISGSGDVSYK
jgi:uncharacterized beta-barrel protein YwiB (DUF1934 family)